MQGAIETGIQVIKLLGIVAVIEFLIFFLISPIKRMIRQAIINRKIKKIAEEFNELAKELIEKKEENEKKEK